MFAAPHRPSQRSHNFPPSLERPLRLPHLLPHSRQSLHLLQPALRLPPPFLPSLRQPARPPHLPLRLHRTGSRPDKSCPPSSRRFRESPSTAPASSRQVSRRW